MIEEKVSRRSGEESSAIKDYPNKGSKRKQRPHTTTESTLMSSKTMVKRYTSDIVK